MIFSRLVLVLVALFACASVVVEGRLREGECEVCIKVTDRFMVAIKEANAKSLEDIETVMTKQCSKKHTKDSQERRFCYYIGGTEDAATGFLRALSQPLSNGLPSEKVCERLKSKDAQICELQYHKAIDIETMGTFLVAFVALVFLSL